MISKLETARLMMAQGIPLVIGDGRQRDILAKIWRKERIGTHFLAHKKLKKETR
ncbi:MAG: hypothetical protein HC904_07385 [Blastochloris sp.]|nr:hypothetical protein [Blastochloris sp.]